MRLAVPRRVYTQSHMDYVVEAVAQVYERREQIGGMRLVRERRLLRHFSAEFAWAFNARRERVRRGLGKAQPQG